jgi:hypothetical protein
MPIIPATWEVEVGGSQSKASPGKVERRLHLKIKHSKRARDLTQVIEDLPSKPKALSSKPSTSKEKEIMLLFTYLFAACLSCPL